MDGTQNINLDTQTLDQCLKATSKYGETIYRNICTGQTYSVPMGQFDWIISILLIGLGVALILLLLKIVISF